MNTIQDRIFQCKLLLKIEHYPEFANQLGIVNKSYFQSECIKSGSETNISQTQPNINV